MISKENEDVIHRCVEHDQAWIDFFSRSNKISADTEVVKLQLELQEIMINGVKSHTYKYNNFESALHDLTYDFVMIDGPYGWNNPYYSRVDILDIIPSNLNNSFVIFLHDVLRPGEANTLELIKGRLSNSGIIYRCALYENTGLIVSEDNKFLCTM